MRILITGSLSDIKLAEYLLTIPKHQGYQWNVITSYQTDCSLWQNNKSVKQVHQATHMKDTDQVAVTDPLVIHVMARSFFDKLWVQNYLQNAQNYIIMVSAPIHYFEKALLSRFDQILITRTLSADKQAMYHNLFINEKLQNLADFKKLLKTLTEYQYVEIVDGRTILHTWYVPQESKTTIVATTLPIGATPTIALNPTPVANSTPMASPSPVATAPVVVTTTTTSSKSETKPNPPPEVKLLSEENKNPAIAVSELWVTFTLNEDVKKFESMFNAMLENELILSMISSARQKTYLPHIEYYFHVYKDRQDLFVALLFNMIQTLRDQKMIKTGAIVVSSP